MRILVPILLLNLSCEEGSIDIYPVDSGFEVEFNDAFSVYIETDDDASKLINRISGMVWRAETDGQIKITLFNSDDMLLEKWEQRANIGCYRYSEAIHRDDPSVEILSSSEDKFVFSQTVGGEVRKMTLKASGNYIEMKTEYPGTSLAPQVDQYRPTAENPFNFILCVR